MVCGLVSSEQTTADEKYLTWDSRRKGCALWNGMCEREFDIIRIWKMAVLRTFCCIAALCSTLQPFFRAGSTAILPGGEVHVREAHKPVPMKL